MVSMAEVLVLTVIITPIISNEMLRFTAVSRWRDKERDVSNLVSNSGISSQYTGRKIISCFEYRPNRKISLIPPVYCRTQIEHCSNGS